jgi:hypothetical protein
LSASSFFMSAPSIWFGTKLSGVMLKLLHGCV